MKRPRFAIWTCVLGTLITSAHAAIQEKITGDGEQTSVPSRIVEFKAVDTDPKFDLPAATTDYPHCLSDGSLVLRWIDWNVVRERLKQGALSKYDENVTIVRGKEVQTILSTSVPDLTDFRVHDIFPTDSGVYFLLTGTKEKPEESSSGKPAARKSLTGYHNFVTRFDLDGNYKGTTELGTECDMSQPGRCGATHLAVLPNGDMLLTNSDNLTSTLRVFYLKSSGEVMKRIDIPASAKPMLSGDISSNADLQREAKMYLSSVYFTAVGESILIWRANSNDPVVEVTQGGGTREVPVQIPDGYWFADMTPSNDRWVVHFRSANTPPTARMSEDTDSYYDVRPQDGSLAAKLVQKGESPLSIACESSGTYTSYKMNEAGKMILLEGK